jgi:hypothetical protein
MSAIIAVGGFFAALFKAAWPFIRAALPVIVQELRAWMPRMIESIVRRSVKQLPVDWQELYGKKWREQLIAVPGEISKFVTALGFFLTARRLAPRLKLGAPGVPVAFKVSISVTLPRLRVHGEGHVSPGPS